MRNVPLTGDAISSVSPEWSRTMLDMVDAVRPVIEDNELYSPSDLASILEQPIERVTRVLEFLKRYNFADQITRREMLFRKTAATVGPCDALRVLQRPLGDAHAIDAAKWPAPQRSTDNINISLTSDCGTGSVDPKIQTGLAFDGQTRFQGTFLGFSHL